MNHRTLKSLFVAFLLPILVALPSPAAASDAVVAQHLGIFLQAYLGRKPSAGELRAISDEFVVIHSSNGKNLASIRKLARWFADQAPILRRADRPQALAWRHRHLEHNYFLPKWRNSLSLRLLAEPDPVAVIDDRSRRLMTEADVVALANLLRFGNGSGPPRHDRLSRAQLNELVARLQSFIDRSDGGMPPFFTEAAALWSGVRHEWRQLDAKGRELVRAYVGSMGRARLPSTMHARLSGTAPKAAPRSTGSKYLDATLKNTELQMMMNWPTY